MTRRTLKKGKYPCKNFIRDGYCNENNCKFIHDKRLSINTENKICLSCKSKNIDNTKDDVFDYYPDNRKLKHKKDTYIPNKVNETERLDIFKYLSSGKSIDNYVSNYQYKKNRLNIFMYLSNGKSMNDYDSSLKTHNLYNNGNNIYKKLIEFTNLK